MNCNYFGPTSVILFPVHKSVLPSVEGHTQGLRINYKPSVTHSRIIPGIWCI